MAGSNASRAWTEYEIGTLKTLAGKRSTAQIAVELDRTIGAIIQKAFDLRLSLKVRVAASSKTKNGPEVTDEQRA